MTRELQPDGDLRVERVQKLTSVALRSLVLAVTSGGLLWLLSPAPGSFAESLLGIVAVLSFVVCGLLAIAAVAYTQLNGLWHMLSGRLRLTLFAFTAVAVALTLSSLGGLAVDQSAP